MPAGPHIKSIHDLPQWSPYAVMMRDVRHHGAQGADGVLMQGELENYIQLLRGERDEVIKNHGNPRALDIRLQDSERMLDDMRRVGADGLSYLPDAVEEKGFDPALVNRIVEMLVIDDQDRRAEINQPLIDKARARYLQMHPRSGAELASQKRALDEIGAIAHAFDLRA